MIKILISQNYRGHWEDYKEKFNKGNLEKYQTLAVYKRTV